LLTKNRHCLKEARIQTMEILALWQLSLCSSRKRDGRESLKQLRGEERLLQNDEQYQGANMTLMFQGFGF
jgi:hypothetical protein